MVPLPPPRNNEEAKQQIEMIERNIKMNNIMGFIVVISTVILFTFVAFVAILLL